MKCIFSMLMLLTAQTLLAQNPTFPPVGDLEGDASLMTCIGKLKEAVAQKDINYLISVMDEKVISGFDSEVGVDEFVQVWGLREDTSYFWGFISGALDLSGAFVNDPNDKTGKYQVVFPYVYNFEPALEDDFFALGCITGKNVNLREKPDTKSAVKTQLTYDVIWFLAEDPSGPTQSGTNLFGEPEWHMVETYDHRHKGWVFWKYVYSVVGPRLFLYKDQRGKWLISCFVAGD